MARDKTLICIVALLQFLVINLLSLHIFSCRDELQQEKQKQKAQQANATNKITTQVKMSFMIC